jgi:hypothetical protein
MPPFAASLLPSAVLLGVAALTAGAARGDAPHAAPAPAAAPLALAVRGAPPRPIADAIADELGVPVAIATGEACAAPCVSIAVAADRTAIIAVTLPDGAQARTIGLPADPEDAAEIIALVVGNLARDQAAALLATLAPTEDDEGAEDDEDVESAEDTEDAEDAENTATAEDDESPLAPTAPLAPQVADPEATSPDAPRTTFAIGLIPPLAFESTRAHRGVAIDLVIGARHRLHAFAVAGVAGIVRDDVTGTQLGGALAYAGQLTGTQVGGAVAIAGLTRGTQVGGALAIAGPLRGAQLGGAAALARRVDGVQVGGALAVSRGDARGLQVGGAIALAGGAVDTQIGGAVAVARRVRGLQLAGVVNVADRVDGVQVGVVNIARGGDGVSIGLVNLVAGGRTDVEGTIDTDRLGAVILRHGSRRWHNAYGIAGRAADDSLDRELGDDEPLALGLGMGPTWRRGATAVDLELMSWVVSYGGRFDDHLNTLNQLRLTVSRRLGPMAVVGGGALNVFVTDDPRRDRLGATARMPTIDDDQLRVELWPTAFVGLRL